MGADSHMQPLRLGDQGPAVADVQAALLGLGLLAVGFKTVRPHHHYPRLRMELRTVLSWREDVEVALERLLGSMTPSTPQGALRPVLPVPAFP